MNDWRELMPRVLREIAELIGVDGALLLVEHYGGTRLTIPQKMHADHPLAQLLGMERAKRLARRFAREKIDLPMNKAPALAARNAEIRRLNRSSDPSERRSVRELALMYRLTERRIWEILADERDQDDRQQALL